MPTLRERLPSWLGGKRAGTEAVGFHPMTAKDFGPGIGNQPSHQVLLRESLGVADMATRAIANRVSTLNPQVKVSRVLRNGTAEDHILDGHRLKGLIDRPHPDITRAMLLRLTAQWIVTTGVAYWLKVGSRLQVPVELSPIPPDKVTPLLYGGVVESYSVLDGNGKPIRVPRENIVRFYFPDPENPWGAEGYLGPAGVTADSLKFAGQHLRAHYENDATPKTALESGENAAEWKEPERKRFFAKWRQSHHQRRGEEIGAPAILPLGYKLVQLAMKTGADIVPLLEYWQNQQLMGFGTPRSILGEVTSGDRSAAETQQYVFDRHAVTPIANLIADAITLQLAPDFDSKLFVEFEPFVSVDKEFDLKRETADLLNKVRSINKVLTDRGDDEVEWGELPVATIGQQPYDPDAITELSMDVPTAIEDEEPEEPEEEEDEEPRARTRGQWFTAKAEWARQIKREKKWVPLMLRAVRSILKDQLRSVLNALDDQEPRSRVTAETLFDPHDWENLFELRTESLRSIAFQEIMRETLVGLGVEEAFIFTEQMQAVLRDQGAQMIRQVNTTTGKRIAKAISDSQAADIAAQLEVGTGAGEGIDQIAKRIQGVFKVRRKEARTIARTEILKASQTAQLEGFELSGVVEKKQWNTSLDAAVRDEHAYAEGQIRVLGAPFDLAGEAADAPGVGAGGGSLSAGNSINCRCFVTPVMGD